jgi:hypothetical protein
MTVRTPTKTSVSLWVPTGDLQRLDAYGKRVKQNRSRLIRMIIKAALVAFEAKP